jgi:crotonobetainyl-CoA:carnitine CoA-transferase CaiB-like acyl-CoA transferase
MLESVVPEYHGAGEVRGPSGTTLTGIVPTNTYPCADGKYVIVGGNTDSIFQRLMRAAGRDDLADDARLADNAGRVTHQQEVDAAIAEWTSRLPSSEVLARLEQASVPCGPIYTIEDMSRDSHYRARGMFECVEVDGQPLEIPAIVPRLADTPGATLWPGPALGEHNEEIYGGVLGYSASELKRLADEGVI